MLIHLKTTAKKESIFYIKLINFVSFKFQTREREISCSCIFFWRNSDLCTDAVGELVGFIGVFLNFNVFLVYIPCKYLKKTVYGKNFYCPIKKVWFFKELCTHFFFENCFCVYTQWRLLKCFNLVPISGL